MQSAQQLVAVRIKDGLFVGNQTSSQDNEFLFMNKVTHIINCAGSETPNLYQQANIHYLSFHWRDLPNTVLFDAEGRNVRQIVDFIEKGLDKGECVLVHSVLGVSRSCAVVAAYLMQKYGWSLDNTIAFMRTAHPDMDIKPYFLRQLGILARRLELEYDIFHPEIDVDSFALDNEQWMLRNTYTNSLGFDHVQNGDIRKVVIEYEERERQAAASRPPKKRITFSDTGQGTAVSSAVTKPIIAGKAPQEIPEKLRLAPATRGILAKAPIPLKQALQSPDGMQCTKEKWPLKSQHPNIQPAHSFPKKANGVPNQFPHQDQNAGVPVPAARVVDGPQTGVAGVNYSAFQSRFEGNANTNTAPAQPVRPADPQPVRSGYSSFTSLFQPQGGKQSPLQRAAGDPVSLRTSSPTVQPLQQQQHHPNTGYNAAQPAKGAPHALPNGSIAGTPAWAANINGNNYVNPNLIRQDDSTGFSSQRTGGFKSASHADQTHVTTHHEKEPLRRENSDLEQRREPQQQPQTRGGRSGGGGGGGGGGLAPSGGGGGGLRGRQGQQFSMQGPRKGSPLPQRQDGKQTQQYNDPNPSGPSIAFGSSVGRDRLQPDVVSFGGSGSAVNRIQAQHGLGRAGTPPKQRAGSPSGRQSNTGSPQRPMSRKTYSLLHGGSGTGRDSPTGRGSGRDSPTSRREPMGRSTGRESPLKRGNTPVRDTRPGTPVRDTRLDRSGPVDAGLRARQNTRGGDSQGHKAPSSYESWVNDYSNNGSFARDEFGQPDTRGTADRKVKKKTGLAPSGNNPSPLVSGVRKPTRTSSASDRLMQPTASFLRKTSRT